MNSAQDIAGSASSTWDRRSYAAAMTSRITLTDIERAYVQSQPLGRLATVDAEDAPQNNPVGVFLDEENGDIIIGGGAMGATRKFRNVRNNPQVALVIDDLVSRDPWTVRGVEIRGTAVALSDVDPPVQFMSREVIRITPHWVLSWGLDPG
jgi:pyridoxamine 5'-phosphate oxidase family protein